MDDADPRGRWRHLPRRIRPEEMVAEVDASPCDSSTAADENEQQREIRWLLERGGGLGVQRRDAYLASVLIGIYSAGAAVGT